MAVTLSALTTGTDTSDGTGFSTASVSPATDDVLLVGVATTAGASAPTLTGLGATWVLVDSAESIQRRIDVFRAQIPAGTSGAITITYGASVDHCSWAVVDCDGAQTGNNGADAIELTDVYEGSVNESGASVDVSGSETGATIGFAAHQRANGITSGQTSLWNSGTSSPSGRYGGGWDATGAGTISFTVSTDSIWTVVGVRVVEASEAPTNPTVKVKVSGSFVEKPLKVRVGGSFV